MPNQIAIAYRMDGECVCIECVEEAFGGSIPFDAIPIRLAEVEDWHMCGTCRGSLVEMAEQIISNNH